MIYAGEFDSQDGPKTIEGWLRDTPFTTIGDFWTQNRPVYWVPNPDTSDPPVDYLNGGLYRTGGTLTFLTLPKAGHFAPNNNYYPTLQFFTDYLNSQQLVAHNPGAATTSDAMCSYMSSCSGHGSCKTDGQCLCDAGYTTADCSVAVNSLDKDGIKVSESGKGPAFISFQSTAGCSGKKMTLTGNDGTPATIYFGFGANEANQFSHDMMLKGVESTAVTFNCDDYPGLASSDGFIANVHIEAIELLTTTLQDWTLEVSMGARHALLATSTAALALSMALI